MQDTKFVKCPKCGKLYLQSANTGWCSCETEKGLGQ